MPLPFVIIKLDKPRKLRLSMETTVEYEEITGTSILDFDDEMSMKIALKLLWIILKQEDKALTFKASCELVDNSTYGAIEMMQKVSEAVGIAFSGKKKAAAKAKNAKAPAQKKLNA